MINAGDRLTEELGVSPDDCAHCGREIWADDEIGIYVDIRVLEGSPRMEYMYCDDDTEIPHRPA